MRYLQIKFYMSSGSVIDAVIESDGVSLDSIRIDIQQTIDNDETYVLHNVIDDSWIVLQGNKIEALNILDLGEDYLTEGFEIK